jgi:hypothetical protein
MDPKDIGKPTAPAQADPNSPFLKDMDQRYLSEMSKLRGQGKLAGQRAAAARLVRVIAEDSTALSLTPLLFQARLNLAEETDAVRLVSASHPTLKWASLTNPERHRLMQKLAHKPILFGQGLNKSLIRERKAFMLYRVNPSSNNSKFYEGMIQDEDGGFRVIRRWGALTDSGKTGRIDGAKFDSDGRFWFPTLRQAQKNLMSHYAKRLSHGYIDAFGREHVTPEGKKLPMGQYPVGLARQTGFGWGTQSVTKCIPGLRQIQEALEDARSEIQQTGQSKEIKDHLDGAVRLISTVAHEDSTMAQKLKALLSRPYRRVSGSPRFLPDPEGKALGKELFSILNYVKKQLSHCQ